MIMPTLTVELMDYSLESTRTTLNVANDTGSAAISTAIAGVTFTDALQARTYSEKTEIGTSAPTSSYAQRELKLLLVMSDTVTGRKFTSTIGVVNAAVLDTTPGTDVVNLDDAGVGAALKAAYESNVLSIEGNPIEVLQARIVGRNS